MKKPGLLVLIRHGESLRNVLREKSPNRYCLDGKSIRQIKGIRDYEVPLTDEGHEQARKTGIALRKEFGVFDCIYHSGYKRTIQTLDGILSAYKKEELLNIKIRRSLFLRERDSGYTYNMTDKQVNKYFPYFRKYWQEAGGFFARPPGGESLAEAAERVYTLLGIVNRLRAGQKVGFIGHGRVKQLILFWLLDLSYDQMLNWPKEDEPKNCGVTVFKNVNEKLILQKYNSIYY